MLLWPTQGKQGTEKELWKQNSQLWDSGMHLLKSYKSERLFYKSLHAPVYTASFTFGLNIPQERVINQPNPAKLPAFQKGLAYGQLWGESQASEILQCSWLGKFTHFIPEIEIS